MSEPNGPLPGFEPPSREPASYPSQLPSYEQAVYPTYEQAPYPGQPVTPSAGVATPPRRPGSVIFAFRLILLGSVVVAAMLVLAFVIGNDELEQSARDELAKDGPYTDSDVQFFKAGVIGVSSLSVAVPMALIIIFGAVMRGGRNWARVTLTVLLSLGLLGAMITALAPAYLPVRLLAVLMFPLNVAIIVAMFQSTANRYFDQRARMRG